MGAEEEEISVELNVRLDPVGTGQVAVRQVVLGLAPYILIQPDYDEDSATLNVTGAETDLDDLEWLLETILNGVRLARQQ